MMLVEEKQGRVSVYIEVAQVVRLVDVIPCSSEASGCRGDEGKGGRVK